MIPKTSTSCASPPADCVPTCAPSPACSTAIEWPLSAAALAVAVALIALVGWVARLGWLADLLSRPVLVGLHGRRGGGDDREPAAEHLRHLLLPRTTLALAGDIPGRIGHARVAPLPVGLVTVGALLALQLFPRLPGPLVVVLAATAATSVFRLAGDGVATIGQVPRGLPPLSFPGIPPRLWPRVIAAAAGISVVVFSDTILTARAFASRAGDRIDANQELLALAGANAAAGTSRAPTESTGRGQPLAVLFRSECWPFSRFQYLVVSCSMARELKTIYLVRHAGSETRDPSRAEDDQRAPAGPRRRAEELADRVNRERPRPSVVLCSASAEALETCAAISTALASAASIVLDEGLEEANGGELLARLQSLSDDVEAVLVIGHNPGLQSLALGLAGDGVDVDLALLRSRLPNGALVKLSTGSTWIDLWPGGAYLEGVDA